MPITIGTAHYRRAVGESAELLYMCRQIADGKADAAKLALIRLRAVYQKHMMQRHLAGLEGHRYRLGFFFFSSRRRHTRLTCDWSSDVCSSDLRVAADVARAHVTGHGVHVQRTGDRAGAEVAALRLHLDRAVDVGQADVARQIGRASCRERV